METLPEWLKSLDSAIRAVTKADKGGMPDVIGWNQAAALETALFVECKGPKERIRQCQKDWISAAFMSGVQPSQVAISLRSF
jgi:hypothetical protein